MLQAISDNCPIAIPPRSAVGLKPEHFNDILADLPDLGWFEIHAENYMSEGGASHAYLRQIREHYPLSVHGVGLSIGTMQPLDKDHLERLARVCEIYKPGLVSEHLAWSSHEGDYFNDLLPLPYNEATLASVCEHIDQVQERLGRQMLLENPAAYIGYDDNTFSEVDFLDTIVKKTGCGLLLDVNNVYVSCINSQSDYYDYIDTFPIEHVQEIHLGGHEDEVDDDGAPLLIDAHNKEVITKVWGLYRHTLSLGGVIPTLIEWDNNLPTWPVLYAEAQRAEAVLKDVAQKNSRGNISRKNKHTTAIYG